jgi:superfamily II RNA helicase
MRLTSVDEGDLAMLVFRTADNLRQIVALEGTHPQLAVKARKAVQLVLREPVVILT